jgi:hypothetical protein
MFCHIIGGGSRGVLPTLRYRNRPDIRYSSKGLDVWNDVFADVTKEVLAAGVISIAGAAAAFILARIPLARRWFAGRRLAIPLIAAFFISFMMAGAMGLILRHQTRKEVESLRHELVSRQEMVHLRQGFVSLTQAIASSKSGLSILAGGRVDETGLSDRTEQRGSLPFVIEKKKDVSGKYIVRFQQILPNDSIILVSSLKGQAETSAGLLNTFHSSFEVQTLLNSKATDAGFQFVVFNRD